MKIRLLSPLTVDRRLTAIAVLMFLGGFPFSPAASQQSYFYVANTRPPDDFLSLRSAPSANSGTRLAKLRNGTTLQVLQRRMDGWWLVRVIPSGEQGWVLSGQHGATWIECCIVQKDNIDALSPATREEATKRDAVPAPTFPDQRGRRAGPYQQQSQERYLAYKKQQQADIESSRQKSREAQQFQARLNSIPTEPSHEEQIRTLCRDGLTQATDPNSRAVVNWNCTNKLASIKDQRERNESAEKSRVTLDELLAQVARMPTTEATLAELTRQANSPRLPTLIYADQELYLKAIARKRAEVEGTIAKQLEAKKLAAAKEAEAKRIQEFSDRLSSADPELKRFVDAHPELKSSSFAHGAMEMLATLYAADVALEYCAEQSFFSRYRGPLAETRRREIRLGQVAELHGVPRSKIEQLTQRLPQIRQQLRHTMKWDAEPASKTCDDFVLVLTLNQNW